MRMALVLLPLASGLLFGVGLVLSGMANPAKVQNFLDLAGPWDPTLALVMAGALAVTVPGYAWLRHRRQTLLGQPLQWPAAHKVDVRLLLGAALFGIGWGLSGYCPGPAVVGLGLGSGQAALLLLAMLAGTLLHDRLLSRLAA